MSESDSRDSVGQSADDVLKTSKHHDLRTRIAAALMRTRAGIGLHSYQLDDMADAVIRELGLRIEAAYRTTHPNYGSIRYVTEWETND